MYREPTVSCPSPNTVSGTLPLLLWGTSVSPPFPNHAASASSTIPATSRRLHPAKIPLIHLRRQLHAPSGGLLLPFSTFQRPKHSLFRHIPRHAPDALRRLRIQQSFPVSASPDTTSCSFSDR